MVISDEVSGTHDRLVVVILVVLLLLLLLATDDETGVGGVLVDKI